MTSMHSISQRARVCLIGLLTALIVAGAPHVAYTQAADSIQVKLPPGLARINPKDLASTHYRQRASEILPLVFEASNRHGQKINPSLLPLHSRLSKEPGSDYTFIFSIPYVVSRWYFSRRFEMGAFERFMAIMKSNMRQFFSAEGIRNSIRNAPQQMVEAVADAKMYPSDLPTVDSLSYGQFRHIDFSSQRVYYYFLEQAFRIWRPRVVERNGKQLVVVEGQYTLGEYDEVIRNWHAGDPITMYQLVGHKHNGLALQSVVVYPVYEGDVLRTTADIDPYTGTIAVGTYEALLSIERWPQVTLEEAAQIVEAEKGERVIKAIYADAFNRPWIPTPVVCTDQDNVYIVDPLVRKVW